jgi:serine/threonine-protein kinase RsbT
MGSKKVIASRMIPVRNEADVIFARMQTRQVAKDVGFQMVDQARISLAVSSLAHLIRLGVQYHGCITVNQRSDEGRSGVEVVWTITAIRDSSEVMKMVDDPNWRMMVDQVITEILPDEELRITAVKWDKVSEGWRKQ